MFLVADWGIRCRLALSRASTPPARICQASLLPIFQQVSFVSPTTSASSVTSSQSLFAPCWQTSSRPDNQVHRRKRYSRGLMFPRLFAASGRHFPLDGGTARLGL